MYSNGKISYRLTKLGDLNWILERVSTAFPRPVARRKKLKYYTSRAHIISLKNSHLFLHPSEKAKKVACRGTSRPKPQIISASPYMIRIL